MRHATFTPHGRGRPEGFRKPVRFSLALLLILPALLVLAVALAQAAEGLGPDATYSLARAVVGAGGLHATGAGFALDATAGQPAAGLVGAADAELTAGFWSASEVRLYLPLIRR